MPPSYNRDNAGYSRHRNETYNKDYPAGPSGKSLGNKAGSAGGCRVVPPSLGRGPKKPRTESLMCLVCILWTTPPPPPSLPLFLHLAHLDFIANRHLKLPRIYVQQLKYALGLIFRQMGCRCASVRLLYAKLLAVTKSENRITSRERHWVCFSASPYVLANTV